MKAISVLGTGSNSGKSWVATAVCAWLTQQGARVAPFKAQNMSNNSYVTDEGGEIGRAQAVQAEACGLTPCPEMNPILLKPSGGKGAQLVVYGRAREHLKAAEYYKRIDSMREIVREALSYWEGRCDVLVLEGAGSPVELNLMDRDVANLFPVRELDGRWLLVADIEHGGVFAQILGTWSLLPEDQRSRGVGAIINKFRGDLSLFDSAEDCLGEYATLPLLGVIPYQESLQPESEDSLSQHRDLAKADAGELAWIRLPHLSNSQDCEPWLPDEGVRVRWATRPADLAEAKTIVLPGTKDTLNDLQWLYESGLARAIIDAARRHVPIVGICGGYQMLGRELRDPEGAAGTAGTLAGLNLLPTTTAFVADKEVRRVGASFAGESWSAYEIRMGRTRVEETCRPLLRVKDDGKWRDEGCRRGPIWGTYLHGLFESSGIRSELAVQAGLKSHRPGSGNWSRRKREVYARMAAHLVGHVNTEPIWDYVAH